MRDSLDNAKLKFDNVVNKFNRFRKSRVRMPKQGRKELKQSVINRQHVFNGAKITFVVVVAVVVMFVGYVGFKMFTGINLKPSPLASDKPASAIIGDQINIMLTGYDTNDRYSFVDFLAVLSINPRDGTQKVVVINPDFTSTYVDGKVIKYRNLLNNALVKDLAPLDTLQRSLEIMLGIRIDRYITVEIGQLETAMHQLGVDYITTEGVLDEDAGEFREGQLVEDNQLIKYLAADEPGYNQKMSRLGKFMKSEMERFASPWRYLSLILNPEPWTAPISTNISRLELMSWALSVLNRTSVQYNYLSTLDGQYHPDLTGGYFVPITLQLDQKIQDIFARSSVIKEQGRVEVYNATLKAGLANVTKRFLVNQGATIIRTGNFSDKQERSKLYVPHPENFTNTISVIKEVLRGRLIIVNDDYPFNHTGDMVLVVGDDGID